MNFLPRAVIGLGVIWTAISIGKWWFYTPDISQFLFGVLTGILIIGSAKLYDLILKLSDRINDLDNGLNALRIWCIDELEKEGRK